MKKLLFVLIALCIFITPVLAADELTGLSDKQILTVYDALVSEILKRNLDVSPVNQRDPSLVFGENVHIQTGQLTNCLPTPMPDNTLLINQANQAILPTLAVAAPTATPIPSAGDKASYDSQYPADGTHFKRGQDFDITWNLLNTGTTTWTRDYVLRFFSGKNFLKPGKARYYLDAPVAPNTVGACKVDAKAPSTPGTYTMAVVLGNENEENFMVVDVTIVVD